MRKIIKLIKEKWLRETSLTILLVVIILSVFILINAIFKNLNLSPIDFTQEKIYTLSEDSKNEIKGIEQNVQMYFFGYNENSTAVSLGNQYHNENDKISVQVITTSERPDLATQFGVSSTDQLVAVSSNQRYKIIESNDMYTYDSSTYKTIDITEQKLTNALLDVTIAKKPQIYFLSGHGEYGISSSSYMYTLSQYITNEVNDVSTIDLLSADMPEICDVLVIANPTKDFQVIETEKIQNYINNGGKIVWMQDPYINIKDYNESNFTNVNKILSQYGISFSKGIVCEQSAENMVAGYPDLIIPTMSYNEIVKDLYTDGTIIIPDAGKINNASDETLESLGVTATQFLKTTSKAFYKESISQNSTYLTKEANDVEGTFTLGETLTKKLENDKTSTLVAFSNVFFVTNVRIQISSQTTTPISLRNNKDIILNTIAYLSNREDSIRIRKDTGVVTFATATKKQDTIVKSIIFGIPVAIIIIGIIITIVRKRRNK